MTSTRNEQRVEQSHGVATEGIPPGGQRGAEAGKDDGDAEEGSGNDGHRCQSEQEKDKNDEPEQGTFATLEEAVQYLMTELRSTGWRRTHQ